MVSIRNWKGFLNLKWIPILAALAIMTGCASAAKKTCLQTDWQRVGYEEGIRGQMAAHSTSQHETCIAEGVPPNIKLYEKGRRDGLLKYCTYDNGYERGVKGDLYQGVCPPILEGPFMDGYHKGLPVYVQQLEGSIRAIVHKQDKLRQELAGVEEDIAYLEKEIAEAGAGQARLGMGMISEMNMLEADQQSLTLQISALEMDLKEMRRRLSQIKEHAGGLHQ
ncbi:MAG: DUF2799 domain-containing protein [Desulfobacteraceae bacterium]|nr:DUF2799 domain-containing protein [Desulfobacteraceae bacterium]